MIEYFEKNWWLWSLRGIVSLLFAFVAWSVPDLTVPAMVLIFSAFVFTDGIFALMTLFARRTEERWSQAAFYEGMTGIVGGIVICLVPESTLNLLACIGTWALLSGSFKVAVAFRCRKASCVPGAFILGLAGLGSIALGFTFTFFKVYSYPSISWLLGAYALLLGLLMLMEGLRLKRFYRIFDVRKVHLQIQHPYYPA